MTQTASKTGLKPSDLLIFEDCLEALHLLQHHLQSCPHLQPRFVRSLETYLASLADAEELEERGNEDDSKWVSVGRAAMTLGTELAAPLRELENGLYRLENAAPENETVKLQAERMRRALQNAETLVRELGELAGPPEALRSPAQLEAVIEKVFETLRWENKLGATEFTAEAGPGVHPVPIDARRLEHGLHVFFSSLLQSAARPKRIAISISNGASPAVGSALAVPGELRCVQCEIYASSGSLPSFERMGASGLSVSVLRDSVKANGGLFEWVARHEGPGLRLTFPISECLGV